MADFWYSLGEWIDSSPTLWRILVILLVTVIINWILRVLITRAVKQVVAGVTKSQEYSDNQSRRIITPISPRAIQRTLTLGSIGRNVITLTVSTIASIMILAELGVHIAAVLASAGVIGAGLAFGAQNIVKDFLNGIFMAAEDQLGVGDYITVGEISGTVEDVGLRVTQVRAFDGTLWFIRNGEILMLGNVSQGWGRAIIDITVDADADIAQVESAALTCVARLTNNPEFSEVITGEPEVLGLESVFGDRATVRLTLQTRAVSQWAVQRELRAIVKVHFAELGISLATELPKGIIR